MMGGIEDLTPIPITLRIVPTLVLRRGFLVVHHLFNIIDGDLGSSCSSSARSRGTWEKKHSPS